MQDGVDCDARAGHVQIAYDIGVWPDADLTAIGLIPLTRYKLYWLSIASKIEKFEGVAWVSLFLG